MSWLQKNSTPAERALRCSFAEKCRDAGAIAANGGVISGSPTFDGEGVILDGVSDYVTYTLMGGEFDSAALSIALEFWPDFEADEAVTRLLFDSSSLYYRLARQSTGVLRLYLGGTVIADIPQLTFAPYWLTNSRNTLLIHSTGSSTDMELNGNPILTDDLTAWAPTRPIELFLGASSTLGSFFKGKIGEFKVFKSLLTAKDAENFYNKNTYDYQRSALVDLPMQAAQHDLSQTGPELLVDGDMEAVGVAAWTVGSSALLTKETGTPHGGGQVLRVTYNGTGNPFAYQTILTSGNKYRVTGWARGDGTYGPRVYSGGNIWVGSFSTSWQYFDKTFTAITTGLSFYALATTAGHCEFDDVSVKQVIGRTLDVSGNGNHATFGDGVTPSTVPTKLTKRGYSFDGGDYLDLPPASFPGATGTFCFLAQRVSTVATVRLIGTADSRGTNYEMRTNYDVVNKQFQVYFPLGTSLRAVASGSVPGTESIFSFVITWERSETVNIYDLYFNGRLVKHVEYTEDPIVTPNTSVSIMKWSTFYTSGEVRAFLASTDVLTPLQVADLHMRMMKGVNRV